MHRLLLSGILWFGLSALGVLHGQEFSMYDFNPIEAQQGFESAAKFSNWKKNGAGTWSRTTGTTNSGSAKGQLSGDLRNGATLINDLFYVRVPQEGINYITVIAWVRRNGSNPLAINIHAATNPEALPIAGGLGTALNPGTGNYSRIQFTFLAQNGALYFPVIYAASTASSATLFVDDVFIYTSTRPDIDETAPPNPFGFSVDVVGDAVELNFTNAPDGQLDLVKTIVLRYDNVVNQNNTAPAVFRPNSIVSTQAEAGANLFGTGRVVYAGPSTTKIIDNATANAVTYVVYSVDKAHNYSIANTGQTMPRILVLKNGASGQSITNNFTTAAFWIGPGSTYTIAGAATMNMSDNGAPGGSKVFGTMWQNTGNINQRANPSSTILYKSGSRHINNRNTVQFPDGNYMPFATWEEGSVAVVTGNKPQGLGNTGQLFHNFIWETSHLGVNFQFGRGFGVKGDFIIRNTYDTAARIYRTLLMPDTVMLIGGNFIIENTATAKVFFPGPANDSLTFGAGNTVKFIGTGNQAFTNNNLTYELFSLDISKPSGSFRLQQDLRLRGNLRVDSGHFDNGDYKLLLKGTRADAALPQIISGEVPISFKEVEVNNTNNAPSIATQQVFRNGQLSNIDYHIADSNYVVVHNDFTVREKLHMVSGKLIAGSKTLTINQAINYAETPAPAGIGGKNNFLGGRPQGNLLLTGNEPQKLLWGIGDNQLDTLRLKYNHADNQIRATLNGLESIFVKNLLLEEGITGHGSKLVQAMDVENAYLWITDSLGISPNSVLNNVSAEGEVTNLSRGTEDASASDAPRNGFGFGIGGNMRVDGTWTFASPGYEAGRVLLKGSSRQNLWGSTPAINWYHAELDNPEGLSVHAHTMVHRNLYFTQGHVHTNHLHNFTFLPKAEAYNADNFKFVNGPMVRHTDASVLYKELINPVGKIGAKNPYRPMKIKPYQNEMLHAFKIEYFAETYENFELLGAMLQGLSKEEYWQVDKLTDGPIEARLGFKYLPPQEQNWTPARPGIKNEVVVSQGKKQPASATNWYVAGELQPNFRLANENNYTLRASWNTDGTDLWTVPMHSFSPFTFGLIGSSILPLKIRQFSTQAQDNNVRLRWKLESKEQVRLFFIEYSKDGLHFTKLSTLPLPADNGEFIHYNPGNGRHFYRLGWAGSDNSITYSAVSMVYLQAKAPFLSHFTPNPFSGNLQAACYMPTAQQVWVSIINSQGQLVYSRSFNLKAGNNLLRLDNLEALPGGKYYLNLTGPQGLLTVQPIMK